jgi:transposase
VEFRELSDEEWKLVKLHPPPKAKVDRPRADDRPSYNDILYVLTLAVGGWTASNVGSYKTTWKRLKRWQAEGVWDGMLKALAFKRRMRLSPLIARRSRQRRERL